MRFFFRRQSKTAERVEIADWRCPDCGERPARFIAPPLAQTLDAEMGLLPPREPPTIVCVAGHESPAHDHVCVSTNRADEYGRHPIKLESEFMHSVIDREGVLALVPLAEQGTDVD